MLRQKNESNAQLGDTIDIIYGDTKHSIPLLYAKGRAPPDYFEVLSNPLLGGGGPGGLAGFDSRFCPSSGEFDTTNCQIPHPWGGWVGMILTSAFKRCLFSNEVLIL